MLGIGYFPAEVILDKVKLRDVFYVIENQNDVPEMIIGYDLIKQTKMISTPTGIVFEEMKEEKLPIEKQINETSSNQSKLNGIQNETQIWNELPYATINQLKTEMNEEFPSLHCIEDTEIRNEVEKLIRNYVPGKIKESPVKLKIVLTDDIPVYQRARRLSPIEKEELNKQIKQWLKDKIIRPSHSDYAVPVVIVPKKDGTKRICVDYRPLNKKTVRDRFPIPNIDEQIDMLEGMTIFTTLDLANGYFHVPMEKESIKYTSFITSTGQYEFLRAPFGLSNCPSVFNRFINFIFAELINERIMLTYMDDMIIPAKSEEEALDKLRKVLEKCKEYGLNIKWKKCSFFQQKIEFLGFEIEKGTIKASTTKTKCVTNYKKPTTTKEIQRFLGLTGYFRRFIQNYSTIALPLSKLLRQDAKFQFGNDQYQAFERLKRIITSRPVLMIFKYGLETEVHTDASKQALAGILFQRNPEDNQFHPVQYMSMKTSKYEENWSSYELEVYAIVMAPRKWRVYLLGSPFKLITDCKAFQDTMNKKNIPKVARWALELQQFEMIVVHRSGQQMRHVDALSRINERVDTILYLQTDLLLSILKRNQNEDDRIKAIIEIIRQKGSYENYFLKNDLLYRNLNGDELLVVPESMYYEIIKRVHD